MNLKARTNFIFLLALCCCVSCSRHVCPTYLTSFDMNRRAIESFFAYYELDSLDPDGKTLKTREGLVVFYRPEEFITYTTWAQDTAGWAGILNDTANIAPEDVKFKSGIKSYQSQWAAKNKPASDLFKPYPHTSVLTGKNKIGLLSKIFKKRPQNFNRYVQAKMNWPKPKAAEEEEDTAIIENATVADLKFQVKKEKRKIKASSEQLFYQLYIVPMLPNFDSLIMKDTVGQTATDTLAAQKPRRWWQFWKLRKKEIQDYQVLSEEDTDEEVYEEEIEVVTVDSRGKEKIKKKKPKKKQTEQKTQEETPPQEEEIAPDAEKDEPPKKKKGKNKKKRTEEEESVPSE